MLVWVGNMFSRLVSQAPGAGVDNALIDDTNLDVALIDDTNTDVALLQD